MSKFPVRNSTMQVIDDTEHPEMPRPYLGMSGIGHPCWRKLWYTFHFVSERFAKTSRTNRIFSVGHMFEEIAIKDLESVGVSVFMVDKDGNRQKLTGKVGELQEEFIGFAGHAKGHPDGRVIGLLENAIKEFLLELKTMNDKYFTDFMKRGIAKSHPVYFNQAQRYMKEMKLDCCFFLAVNKNNSKYHWEFVDYDSSIANELARKERIIITSGEPLDQHFASNHHECGWCDHWMVCHGKVAPEQNCRTCDHSDIDDNGVWACTNRAKFKKDKKLTLSSQVRGCGKWKKGWGL